MPFTTGTATDHHDLLDKLQIYLDAQGWTIDQFSLGATLTDPSTLIVTGPGPVGGQPVHISMQTEADSGLNAYAWKFGAHPDYDPGLPFGAQLNNSTIHYFLLWPNEMDYWFYVNDRRFIVVAKIGVYYMSMYAGFFLPYALPDEYPFPYYLGATFNSLQVYNLANAGMRSFADPGTAAATYLSREDMTWQDIKTSNQSANTVDSYSGLGTQGAFIWPYRGPMAEGTVNTGTEIAWSFFRNMRPLANGKMPMWQATIVDIASRTMAGVLDDVFVTGGFNRVPEQVVDVGGEDYRLFITINRNTPKHYFAIREA